MTPCLWDRLALENTPAEAAAFALMQLNLAAFLRYAR